MTAPLLLNGPGPYTDMFTESSEILVLLNKETGNYIFSLKTEEYGPVIVDSNFERGKAKMKKAFETMLICRSLYSVPENRNILSTYLKENNPALDNGGVIYSDYHLSEEKVDKIMKKVVEKMTYINNDIENNLVLNEE